MSDTGVLTATPTDTPAAPAGTRRIRFWRSPPDQPGWARPALLAIAALAALLYAWNIRVSGYATFYSVAVKSESVSWKAFIFGALDPGATVTIDKLAGSFLPQALSARIFGYHQWSLTLPQVIEGVVSVLAMYRLVRRWFGEVAGLLAAGLFTLTPIVASMFGHPMEDGALTMCLVLAADAFVRALARARLRPLVLAGVWVGLGFQAKMLQAWMVLPALGLTYLICAPTGLRRRLAHLGAAGAAMLAVSLSWIMLYTLTPAADRPYVDGSTNNNAFSMVFGYNGLDRFGISVPGSVRSMFTGGDPGGGPPGGGPVGGGAAKLLGDRYAGQIGWLFPLVLVALVLGLLWYRRAGRADLRFAGFVLWGLWLGTYAAIFSRIAIPHTAYMASLAPPVAALGAAGIVLLWRAYRQRRVPWLLPLTITAEVAWTAYLASRHATFLPWLTWLVVLAGAVSVVVLLIRRPLVVPAMALGTAAMLAVPAAWALSVLDVKYSGSAFDASAGPGGMGGIVVRPRFNGPGPGPGSGPFPFPGSPGRNLGPGGDSTDTLTDAQRRVDGYLTAHRGGARFVAATTSWRAAQPYIMATGRPYLPMGGFSGSVPAPTLAAVQEMVRTGELRYFLLDGGGFGFPGGGDGGDSELSRITGWVTSTCTEVPAEQYGGDGQQSLYRC